jgi:hypothetical protein
MTPAPARDKPGWYRLIDATGRELPGLYSSIAAARAGIKRLAAGQVTRPPRPRPEKHHEWTRTRWLTP